MPAIHLYLTLEEGDPLYDFPASYITRPEINQRATVLTRMLVMTNWGSAIYRVSLSETLWFRNGQPVLIYCIPTELLIILRGIVFDVVSSRTATIDEFKELTTTLTKLITNIVRPIIAETSSFNPDLRGQ